MRRLAVIVMCMALVGIAPAAAESAGRVVAVTSPEDTGPGTLRSALEDQRPFDTITFDPVVFPPDRRVRIGVAGPLPGRHVAVLLGRTAPRRIGRDRKSAHRRLTR